MRGRPKTQLVLSDTEREQLEALTLRRMTLPRFHVHQKLVMF